MYMQEGGVKGKSFGEAPYLYIAIGVATLGTLYFGVMPAPALEWSRVAFPFLE